MKEPMTCPGCGKPLGYEPGQWWPRLSQAPGGLRQAWCEDCFEARMAGIRSGKDRRR